MWTSNLFIARGVFTPLLCSSAPWTPACPGIWISPVKFSDPGLCYCSDLVISDTNSLMDNKFVSESSEQLHKVITVLNNSQADISFVPSEKQILTRKPVLFYLFSQNLQCLVFGRWWFKTRGWQSPFKHSCKGKPEQRTTALAVPVLEEWPQTPELAEGGTAPSGPAPAPQGPADIRGDTAPASSPPVQRWSIRTDKSALPAAVLISWKCYSTAPRGTFREQILVLR